MFEKIKKRVQEIIFPTKDNLSELRHTLQKRQASLKKHRTNEEQETLKDFSVLLKAWGMAKEQIPIVINELEIRCFILLLPMIMCLLITFLVPSHLKLMLIVTMLIMTSCIFAIMTTIWRISILKKRGFIPFSKWLFSFFGSQKGTQG